EQEAIGDDRCLRRPLPALSQDRTLVALGALRRFASGLQIHQAGGRGSFEGRRETSHRHHDQHRLRGASQALRPLEDLLASLRPTRSGVQSPFSAHGCASRRREPFALSMNFKEAAEGLTRAVSGALSQNETWGGTVRIEGDVFVAEGATLRIAAGTRIVFPGK